MSVSTPKIIKRLDFSHCQSLVLFDMEWTAWEGSMQRMWSGPDEHMEVVQIGAVKVDPVTFEDIDTLEVIVKPRINPHLSDYFIDLTGVEQRRVEEEGIDLAEALVRFENFIGDGGCGASNGGDHTILKQNTELYGLPFPFEGVDFVNVRPVVVEGTGIPYDTLVTGELDQVFGFDSDHLAHDALADARKLAQALRFLRAKDIL